MLDREVPETFCNLVAIGIFVAITVGTLLREVELSAAIYSPACACEHEAVLLDHDLCHRVEELLCVLVSGVGQLLAFDGRQLAAIPSVWLASVGVGSGDDVLLAVAEHFDFVFAAVWRFELAI